MAASSGAIEIGPWEAGSARLVTARSYFIDRFVPDCEIVALPAKTVAGGRLTWRRGPLSLPPVPGGGRVARTLRRFRPEAARRAGGRILFDLRLRSPQNWAHWLNNHLPVVFRLCEAAGIGWDRTLLVTPADTPDYMRRAAALFGFELLATDGAVEGDGIAFELAPWTACRAERHAWVRAPRVTAALDAALTGGRPLPRRVFLSRRKGRTIANAGEVEAYLSTRGFETVHPETLSAADQMRLFREAETIVAIHGAGLAPLLYAPEGGRLGQLVEILPVGHMSDAFRVVAGQVGVDWIGVRGRIKPEYVAPAYRFDKPFGAFSLDSFEVDVASLDLAFELAGLRETTHG